MKYGSQSDMTNDVKEKYIYKCITVVYLSLGSGIN